jgi:hypothetical protein
MERERGRPSRLPGRLVVDRAGHDGVEHETMSQMRSNGTVQSWDRSTPADLLGCDSTGGAA